MIFSKILKKVTLMTLTAAMLLSIPSYAEVKGYEVIEGKSLGEVEVESISEGFMRFYNDDWLYGYMNESAEIVIKPEFDDAGDFHSGVAQVTKDGQVFYIDTTGKVLFKLADLEDQFEEYIDVYDFHDGLALVEIGYYDVAYINKKGEFVIPQGLYDYGTSFSEGVAYVSNEDGDYFAIDPSGAVLFKLEDNWEYYHFKNDRAAVYDNDTEQYSYVDKSGELIMGFKLDDAFDFEGEYAVYEEIGKQGIINQSGDFIIDPIFEELLVYDSGSAIGYDGTFTTLLNTDFQPTMRIYGDLVSGSSANTTAYSHVVVDQNPSSTVIRDYAGHVLGEYDEVWSLGKGYFATLDGDIINTNVVPVDLKGQEDLELIGDYVYDFMDNTGNVVLSLDAYDDVNPFSEGLAMVEKDDKFGYVDTKGKLVIPVKYTSAEAFVEGKADVYIGYEHYVIDPSGKVLETSSDDVDSYYSYEEEEDENYYTITVGSYGPMGLAEKASNKIILQPIYEDIDYLGNGIYELMDGDYLYGFYDTKTKKIIEPQYEDYDIDTERGLISVNNDDYKYGIIGIDGRVVLDIIYDYLSLENNSLIAVEKDDIYGLVDLTGKVVLESKYDMIGYSDTVGDMDIYVMTQGDKAYYMTYNTVTKGLNKIVEIDYGGDLFEIMPEGYIAYSASNGNTVFKDLNGKELLTVSDEVVDLNSDYVQCVDSDGQYYLMDFEGKTYLKGNDFEDFYLPVEEGHIIYTDGIGYGIVSLDGHIKTDKMYSNVSYITSGIMAYYGNLEFGYVNLEGKEIQKPDTYRYLYGFTEGFGLGIREK